MPYEKNNKLHIVAVTAAIRNAEGKYLVLRRSERETAFPGMWGFPGGKVEDNDSIEEALTKEVAEEAGLKLKAGKILLKDASFVRPDGQTVKVFAYLCKVENPNEVRVSEDFSEYRWVTPQELTQLPHVGIEEEVRRAEEIFQLGVPFSLLVTKSERFEPGE